MSYRQQASAVRALAIVYVALVACALVLEASSCASLRRAAPLVEPAIAETCMVVDAVTTDGTAHQVCASAEDIAPVVAALLALQTGPDAGSDGGRDAGKPPQIRTLRFGLVPPTIIHDAGRR